MVIQTAETHYPEASTQTTTEGSILQPLIEPSRRYAIILARMIAPNCRFLTIGRSLTYRYGAFHTLSRPTLLQALPASLEPARTRRALTAATNNPAAELR